MKHISLFVGVLFLLSACTGSVANSVSSPSSTQAPTLFPPAADSTPTWTRIPIPTATIPPTRIPTSTWVMQGPGNLTVPILLYHHIDTSPFNSRYYVSPDVFEPEIKVLHDLGYQSISVGELVQAITVGVELPAHPILITFDDGHEDNYTNAFPIMEKYGYTGVLYIVGNYLDTPGYLNRQQILEMVQAGWDVGSHSMNHYDLTKLKSDDLIRREITGSKKRLEDELGIDILTFAYPIGAVNRGILHSVRAAGYKAAMGGEGYTDDQGAWNLFNLQRVEVISSETVDTFTRFFTWRGRDP